jgi:glycosyltransferase involved in cell wall biosynthesis
MDVSVCVITYNQERFISKAIDSILLQKVTFDYEIIIGEDCSKDNTRSICLDYQRKYPQIKLLLPEKNLGFQKNLLNVMSAGSGKYCAILEGDDYWIDDNKLQAQYEFMEANPGVAFCYTNAYGFFDGDEASKSLLIKQDPGMNIFTLDYFLDNLSKIRMPTLTLFIRRAVIPDPFPEWIHDTIKMDWAMDILFLSRGNAAYIDKTTSMYRIHPGGVIKSTAYPKMVSNSLALFKNLDRYFDYKYHKVFGNVHFFYKDLCIYYFQKRKYRKGFYYLLYSFFMNPIQTLFNLYFLKTLFNVLFRGFKVFD